MFLNKTLTAAITDVLLQVTGKEHQLKILKSVLGGSINQCFMIEYDQPYFLKVNDKRAYPRMFEIEAESLVLLANIGRCRVPGVVTTGNTNNEQFLILQWIEGGKTGRDCQLQLGRDLASLHRCSSEYYGLSFNNYMGSLIQRNRQSPDLETFFVSQRLEPQVKIALDAGLIDKISAKRFDRLYSKVTEICPQEKPALVHGDLWGGNYMVALNGDPFLIDPAIAYSHREVDIAMTTLFGGFDDVFYEAYNEGYPLEPAWRSRTALWNLYPLLIHLNLFGTSYWSQIERFLKTFI